MNESLELLHDEEKVTLNNLRAGDIRGGHSYYPFRKNVNGTPRVFILRSDRRLIHSVEERKDSNLMSDQTEIANVNVPFYQSWSHASIKKFAKGESVPTPLDKLYHDVNEILRGAIHCDAKTRNLLTVFIISSYFTNSFPAVPYLHLRGPWGSGKSYTANLLLRLSFNGCVGERTANFAKGSDAAITRAAAESGGVQCYDDLEIISDPTPTPLRQGILVANSKATAQQMLTVRGKVHSFNIYGQKIFTSIGAADPVLRSRIIEVNLQRAPETFEMITPSEETFQNIRDRLHETSFDDEIRREVEQAFVPGGANRLEQITAGMKTIAKLCRVALYIPKTEKEKVSVKTIAVKIFNMGYESLTLSHLQSELALAGELASFQNLGAEVQDFLIPKERLMIHGTRTRVYAPSPSVQKDVTRRPTRDAREYCRQALHKTFVEPRCHACPYIVHCIVRQNKIEEIQEEGA